MDNCQCNTNTTSYCPPMGDKLWVSLHTYYRDDIVPYITDIHVDNYFRYDLWLHDPNTKLPRENAENFAQLVHKINDAYIVDKDYKTCFKKISPFIQRKWADVDDHGFVAKVDLNPHYFYDASGIKLLVGSSALIL